VSGVLTERPLHFLLSLLFIAVAITGVLHGFNWVYFVPAALAAGLLAFVRLDTLMLAAVFVTPLSINLQQTGLGFGISMPAEPMIFAVMMLFFLKLLTDGRLDPAILRHPVTLLIGLHVVWMAITTLTSSMILVSLKATVARLWFVTVFYVLAAHVFSRMGDIRRFVWLYAIPLVGVIAYSLAVFFGHGMTEEIAHVSMVPFYNDHTAYGAAVALFIPPMVALGLDREVRPAHRLIAFAVATILLIAIVFSYTRAAWVSLAAMALCWLVFLLRIRTALVVGVAVIAVSFVLYSWTDIIVRLESNTERSSTDYRAHLESISNISTDASNVERVNRWLCALRMFSDRKLFGFGPGTYQFQYGVFQRNDEKTYISTNFGDVGSSHSEYLGPLSEQGLPGMLLYMAICIATAVYASRYIIRSGNRSGRLLAKGLVLGLVTYYVHGFLNFFLDTDKASVPFWGFTAALTALQAYHARQEATTDAS